MGDLSTICPGTSLLSINFSTPQGQGKTESVRDISRCLGETLYMFSVTAATSLDSVKDICLGMATSGNDVCLSDKKVIIFVLCSNFHFINSSDLLCWSIQTLYTEGLNDNQLLTYPDTPHLFP